MLARFFLREFDQKKKHDDFSRIMDTFHLILKQRYKVNIDVALFGLRNLLANARRPVITLRLTKDKREHVLKMEEPVNTRNPNFGKIVTFKGVVLPVEPLLWPQLEVQVSDEGNMFGLGGCEQCYTTI